MGKYIDNTLVGVTQWKKQTLKPPWSCIDTFCFFFTAARSASCLQRHLNNKWNGWPHLCLPGSLGVSELTNQLPHTPFQRALKQENFVAQISSVVAGLIFVHIIMLFITRYLRIRTEPIMKKPCFCNQVEGVIKLRLKKFLPKRMKLRNDPDPPPPHLSDS